MNLLDAYITDFLLYLGLNPNLTVMFRYILLLCIALLILIIFVFKNILSSIRKNDSSVKEMKKNNVNEMKQKKQKKIKEKKIDIGQLLDFDEEDKKIEEWVTKFSVECNARC